MRLHRLPAVLLAIAALTSSAPAFAQTADEIVAKNMQAKGGAEKWKSIASVKMSGTVSGQGGQAALTAYTKRPNLSRQDILTPKGKLVRAFDGVTPWVLPPGADIGREVSGPEAEAVRSNSDFDGPLVDYAAKGHKLELIGKEKAAGVDVYHLKMTRKDGRIEHYYFDADSGLEVKRSIELDTGGGLTQNLETEMSNFKSVDGIMVPHTLKQSISGKPVAQVNFDKIEINAPMDDALFKMPAAGK